MPQNSPTREAGSTDGGTVKSRFIPLVTTLGAIAGALMLGGCGGAASNSDASDASSPSGNAAATFNTVVTIDLMNDFMPGVVGAAILTDPDWPTNGSKDCEGTEEFAYVKEGAALTIADAAGETVALARLPQGQDVRTSEALPIQCNFTVPVSGIPDSSQFYSVVIEGGEQIQLTAEELQAGPKLLLPGESRR